jgi:hypothetical protein
VGSGRKVIHNQHQLQKAKRRAIIRRKLTPASGSS